MPRVHFMVSLGVAGILSACSWAPAGETQPRITYVHPDAVNRVCIEGTLYLEFDRKLVPAFEANGAIKQCRAPSPDATVGRLAYQLGRP